MPVRGWLYSIAPDVCFCSPRTHRGMDGRRVNMHREEDLYFPRVTIETIFIYNIYLLYKCTFYLFTLYILGKYINILLSAFIYVNDSINSNNIFADKEAYNARLFRTKYANSGIINITLKHITQIIAYCVFKKYVYKRGLHQKFCLLMKLSPLLLGVLAWQSYHCAIQGTSQCTIQQCL